MDQISGTYDPWLVSLSFAVAIVTSYTAVDLAGRVTASRGIGRGIWLSGGAFAMGSGVWCMHFVGMLAFRLPVPVYYHVPTVALSLLAAILASLSALYFVSREVVARTSTVVGSLLMGAGISAMHYIGMEAMRFRGMHEYDGARLAASIIVAIAISFVGLTLMGYLRDESRGLPSKLTIALVLGLAIPAMHYSGMAAIKFKAMSGPVDLTHSVDISALTVFAIFGLTGGMLAFALITSMVDRSISGNALILEKERTMLRALIDHIPDCMYVKDADGSFILANLQLARTLGFEDPQRLIGKSDHDFYPLELATKFSDDERRIISSGVALSEHEEDGIDLAGNVIPMMTTKVPIRDNRGRVTGIAGIGRDISERKKNELALRAAELKYRSMFDEALVGICKLETGGHLIQANPAMAECLGYANPNDMLECVKDSFWSLAASPRRREDLTLALATAGHVRSFELEMLRKDGTSIWISASVRTKFQGGLAVGFVGMCEDISERKVLREQLLQAQKLESVGQLAAGIAHEINTPVQYIGDNVRFLKDTFAELVILHHEYARLLDGAQQKGITPQLIAEVSEAARLVDTDYLFNEIPQAIGQTLDGVARVAALVSAMKEFSHPGTGEKVPLDLNHAIQSTITVARNEWKYVADMKMNLDVNIPLVSCLPGEFNQVILNLIVNAAHAIADVAIAGGPSMGLITVTTQVMPGIVEIRIADTGSGIPEKARNRIFDPFFTTKAIGKGTGQGLAIARSVIVDKHQGSIDFETEEGRGTTFIIRLPSGPDVVAAQARVAA